MRSDKHSEFRRACRDVLVWASVFSVFINLLYLSYPIYMMQVYDRVMLSGNATTLVMLTIVTLLGLLALALLDAVRCRLLVRLAGRVDRHLAPHAFDSALGGATDTGAPSGQVLQDLEEVRRFVGGPAFRPLFDIPWVPLYLVVLFLIHPLLGAVGLVGAAIVLALIVANEMAARRPLQRAAELGMRGHGFAEACVRNIETARAMGMLPGLFRKWQGDRAALLDAQRSASDRIDLLSSAIRGFRLLLQVAILGVAAWLAAVERSITPGSIFIGAIIMGRALMPIDQTVSAWRPTIAARRAWQRLRNVLPGEAGQAPPTELPAPRGAVAVEKVVYAPPGSRAPVLRNIAFTLEPGETLGIVGQNAAGKTTLARLLAGVLQPSAGTIRLDGVDIGQLDPDVRGRNVGYLPQRFELLPGTIAENIGRFTTGVDAAIVEAAQAAGVHEMILRLEQGYDTPVGPQGTPLSAGQTQRIALARALFGRPPLLILDEPNSNLDLEGEQALARALQELKRRGGTVILIAHRPSMMHSADTMMVLKDGGIEMLGARESILERTTPARFRAGAGPKPVRPGDA